ncbi:hypothetical protein J2S13_000368 [Oikeobacillus pervagus]|uniref:DUF2325 domain-containing protein n=2 Tax=Oikeobacillus pervagus TaxID=1325931 RepID=A0AAJ1WI46_9BACI|nr:hypothetical protein [Oikeobacillus pervagus]
MTEKTIGKHTDAVLILTDFINHNLAKAIKEQARDKEIPALFSKRSWSSIKLTIEKANEKNKMTACS